MEKITLSAKLAQITDFWDPKIVAELNGQHVKLAKIRGDFVWHRHDDEDELFVVLKGRLIMHLRDGDIELGVGDCLVVPRGMEHRPEAPEETHIMMFEPVGTLNTGNVDNELTKKTPQRI